MINEFYPIKGYEGLYEINKIGEVKSLANYHRKDSIILKQAIVLGYCVVGLSKNNKRKLYKVHRLLAKNFLPNTENKATVNHKNGIKHDNRLENIEWATYSENNNHALNTNLRVMPKNENHHNCKLTKEDIADIRSKYKSGNYLQKDLSNEYNINFRTVSSIVNNKSRLYV